MKEQIKIIVLILSVLLLTALIGGVIIMVNQNVTYNDDGPQLERITEIITVADSIHADERCKQKGYVKYTDVLLNDSVYTIYCLTKANTEINFIEVVPKEEIVGNQT